MGGAAAGEVASGIVRETVSELFSARGVDSCMPMQGLVEQCFHSAHARILSQSREVPAYSGMGCTAELLACDRGGYVLGHVGDSRTYLLRQGNLELLTTDHTLVQAQQDQGLIRHDQAESHSLRNVILRAVGIGETLEVDIIQGSIQPGDLFLLCSDGLSTMVDDEKIKEMLAFDGPLPVKATLLVDQANSAGGRDNVSVVLVAAR
jgi:protein phosphatase